jgi:hypothetical protein
MAADGRRIEITSTFASPPLMPWPKLPSNGS